MSDPLREVLEALVAAIELDMSSGLYDESDEVFDARARAKATLAVEPEYEYRAVTPTGTYPSCGSESAAKASLVVGKFTRQHSAIWRRVKAVPAGEWERLP